MAFAKNHLKDELLDLINSHKIQAQFTLKKKSPEQLHEIREIVNEETHEAELASREEYDAAMQGNQP